MGAGDECLLGAGDECFLGWQRRAKCFVVGEVMSMEDDGSAERQIQSVFDFLDESDDLNRGLEYWGANPRHSPTQHDDDDDCQEHKTIVADSSDDDVS